MLFENSHCKQFVSPAVPLLVFACLAVGCEANLEPTDVSKPQAAPASVGSELAQSELAQSELAVASPSLLKQPKADLAGNKEKIATEDKPATKDEPATKSKYTEARLHKNHTTLLLAAQPDLRALQLLIFVVDDLTDEQLDQAMELILKEDDHFQRLIERRKEVLNVATDGDQTEEKLRQIKIETLDHSARLRQKVIREILTPEQKERRKIQAEQLRLEKEAEAKKAEQRRLEKEAEAVTEKHDA